MLRGTLLTHTDRIRLCLRLRAQSLLPKWAIKSGTCRIKRTHLGPTFNSPGFD